MGNYPHICAAGTIALSGKLADSLDALYNGRIPKDWLAKSWEAGSLGSWFAGLMQRHEQLLRWLNTGRPKSYWLTGFFNPQVDPLCHASSSSSTLCGKYVMPGLLQCCKRLPTSSFSCGAEALSFCNCPDCALGKSATALEFPHSLTLCRDF